jgi:hypothetical protein
MNNGSYASKCFANDLSTGDEIDVLKDLSVITEEAMITRMQAKTCVIRPMQLCSPRQDAQAY